MCFAITRNNLCSTELTWFSLFMLWYNIVYWVKQFMLSEWARSKDFQTLVKGNIALQCTRASSIMVQTTSLLIILCCNVLMWRQCVPLSLTLPLLFSRSLWIYFFLCLNSIKYAWCMFSHFSLWNAGFWCATIRSLYNMKHNYVHNINMKHNYERDILFIIWKKKYI